METAFGLMFYDQYHNVFFTRGFARMPAGIGRSGRPGAKRISGTALLHDGPTDLSEDLDKGGGRRPACPLGVATW